MKIYVGIGNANNNRLAICAELGLGLMITSPSKVSPSYKSLSCALDNGGFTCNKKGYPFMKKPFLDTLYNAYNAGVTLDFIVCPDVLSGGLRSLDVSMQWANGELYSASNLALVVQDGMVEADIERAFNNTSNISHLFVGGSPEWKWKTVEDWANLAKKHSLKIHVGQVGTLERLEYCEHICVDSVDSTSWLRNNTWHILEEYKRKSRLF